MMACHQGVKHLKRFLIMAFFLCQTSFHLVGEELSLSLFASCDDLSSLGIVPGFFLLQVASLLMYKFALCALEYSQGDSVLIFYGWFY